MSPYDRFPDAGRCGIAGQPIQIEAEFESKGQVTGANSTNLESPMAADTLSCQRYLILANEMHSVASAVA